MTQKSYLLRVAELTPTEFWINNPTPEQTELALAHGATGCTNNPSFTQRNDRPPRRSRVRPAKCWTKPCAESERRLARQSPRSSSASMAKPICREVHAAVRAAAAGETGYVTHPGRPDQRGRPERGDPRRAGQPHALAEHLLQDPHHPVRHPTAMEYLVGQKTPP